VQPMRHWRRASRRRFPISDGPVAIEINPRLTTSYVRLRDALGANPAGLVLQLLDRDLATIAVPRPAREQPVRIEGHAA
jgi:predicted ATP-grasp superfamily ATP-dependent carboligase